MSKRDVRLFLQEILEAIDKVMMYIHGLDYHNFEDNSLVKDAVIRMNWEPAVLPVPHL